MIIRRSLLIILGIFLGLLIVEILLNIYGLVNILLEKQKNIEITNKDNSNFLNILCIGDSFTYGVGARKGYSYPEQLQRLLDRNNIKYKVYNLGIPGSNSSMVVLNFDHWVKIYNPHIVILMIGTNDNWNFKDSNYYLFYKNSILGRFYRILFNFKTYKFLNILTKDLSKRKINSNLRFEYSYPTYIKEKIELARWKYFHLERNFDKVKEIIEEILKIDNNNYDAYLLLGWIYLDTGEYFLAEENLKKAKDIDPNRPDAYEQLFRLYTLRENTYLAKAILREMLKIQPEREEIKILNKFGIPSYNNFKLWAKVLEYNLDNIIKKIKNKDIKIILMNYPYPRPLHTNIIYKVANKYKILLLDNGLLLDKNKNPEYFTPDGHPNELGYNIIAKKCFYLIKQITAE